MVARSEDKPRTVTDRIDAASRRLDELARAQANGSPSLYNEAGHLLTLDAQSATPFLVPRGTDSGLRFNDGQLEVTDPTGTEYRDLRVRRLRGTDVAFRLDTSMAYVVDGGNGNTWRALQTGDSYVHGVLYLDGDFRPGGTTYSTRDINAPKFRGNLGGPGDGYDGYGTWHGNVQGDGVATTVSGGTLTAGGTVNDALGNVRNGASMPEVKQNATRIKPDDALAALAKLTYYVFQYVDDESGDWFAGPMLPEIVNEPLLAAMVRNDDSGDPASFNIQSMVGMIAAALPAVRATFDQQLAALAPLQQVAASLPGIVKHSDDVHEALQTGQEAIGQAVAAVQAAAQSLTTSLGPIAQTAAQAYAAAAVANSKVTALEARVAALEARRVSTCRAAGNLPTLALNGTTVVSCPWTSPSPSPLPAVDQCQVFVAGGSAVPTVTAVGATGVTVSLKATGSVLPATGGVQVIGVTW